MHLVFVDIAYGYTADRPDTGKALGGTTSAICFLARELVKKGVTCTFYNRITEPGEAHGIRSLPLDRLIDGLADPAISAVIYCGRWLEPMVQLARQASSAPFVAWMHESSLHTKLTMGMDAFDAIAFVSEWQQRVNQPYVKPKWKQAVLRNAMNPRAAASYPAGAAILPTKKEPPVLIFAGGVVRGAAHLPPILDKLRAKTTDFSMEIYCNTDPSGNPETDAQYIGWLRSLPNVTHVGQVGQGALLDRMQEASVLVSPNPWPETSCIAMIEAMASGLQVITTNRAALPETASGFAKHIPIENAGDPMSFDMEMPVDLFADTVFTALKERKTKPEQTEKRLREQVDYFQAHYQWTQRVAPWVEFIQSLK